MVFDWADPPEWAFVKKVYVAQLPSRSHGFDLLSIRIYLARGTVPDLPVGVETV
jgi:hypothetical protein